ncbi:hypothetical protein ACFQ1L_35745 [Phytohabitans flavus]|uniref:MmyB family transcriptional regulator n=1 Tax=Phytohabitans flavus TaxID=1076124 RepID=UPI003629ED37
MSPGLLRIFDRLTDSPSEIVNELGETLRQTPLGIALTGDNTRYAGPARSAFYRWFTDPAERALYHPGDHDHQSRVFAAAIRKAVTLRGPESRAAQLADLLLARSREFPALWREPTVDLDLIGDKRFAHPELGALELSCHTLHDPEQEHTLVVYTAVPGSESYNKLQLLSVIAPF